MARTRTGCSRSSKPRGMEPRERLGGARRRPAGAADRGPHRSLGEGDRPRPRFVARPRGAGFDRSGKVVLANRQAGDHDGDGPCVRPTDRSRPARDRAGDRRLRISDTAHRRRVAGDVLFSCRSGRRPGPRQLRTAASRRSSRRRGVGARRRSAGRPGRRGDHGRGLAGIRCTHRFAALRGDRSRRGTGHRQTEPGTGSSSRSS